MTVYLQSFFSKSLIDDGIKSIDPAAAANFKARAYFGLASMSGTIQTVSYLAATVFTHALVFITLGMSKTLNAHARKFRDLTLATSIATGMGLSGMVKTDAPQRATNWLKARATEQMMGSFDPITGQKTTAGYLDQAAISYHNFRISYGQRRIDNAKYWQQNVNTQIYNTKTAIYLNRMQRAITQAAGTWNAITDSNKTYETMIAIRDEIDLMQSQIKKKTRSLPITQDQSNQYFFKKAEKFKQKLSNHFYATCKAVSDKYALIGGEKFDRIAFNKVAKSLYHEINKQTTEQIEKIKTAQNVEQEFYRFDRSYESKIKTVTKQIENLAKPSLATRYWRAFKPYGEKIPGLKTGCQKFNTRFDPAPPPKGFFEKWRYGSI